MPSYERDARWIEETIKRNDRELTEIRAQQAAERQARETDSAELHKDLNNAHAKIRDLEGAEAVHRGRIAIVAGLAGAAVTGFVEAMISLFPHLHLFTR